MLHLPSIDILYERAHSLSTLLYLISPLLIFPIQRCFNFGPTAGSTFFLTFLPPVSGQPEAEHFFSGPNLVLVYWLN